MIGISFYLEDGVEVDNVKELNVTAHTNSNYDTRNMSDKTARRGSGGVLVAVMITFIIFSHGTANFSVPGDHLVAAQSQIV